MGKLQFQVSTHWTGRKRLFTIIVYDTVKELQKAGERHNYQVGISQSGFDNAWGLTQSFDAVNVYESGRVHRKPKAGYIRFVKGHLGSGLIAHECTHAAIAIYKQDIAKTIPDMEREEKLCYLVGDLMSKIVRKLYAKNAFEEEKS